MGEYCALPVCHQGAVPGGVDVRHAGGETFVHHNGALFHLDASALQKGGVGPDARGHHHSAAGQQAGVCLYALHLAIAHKGRGLGAGEHPDTLLLQVALDVAGHLPIQHAGEDLGGHFHHGDGNAPVKEVLRQLQADEAAAHHRRAGHAQLFAERLAGNRLAAQQARQNFFRHVFSLHPADSLCGGSPFFFPYSNKKAAQLQGRGARLAKKARFLYNRECDV